MLPTSLPVPTSRSVFTRILTTAVLVASMVSTEIAVIGPRPTLGASGDRRPNLEMVPLSDLRVETTASGRRLLRFTTVFVNSGPGPFELRGRRASRADQTMDVDQVMHRWDGSTRRIDTPSSSRYAGDGHDHWHVQDVVTYEAWKVTASQGVRRGAKTGFCFFDTTPWRRSLPGARQSPYYQQQWCGTHASLDTRVGVSVGWGDRYPWNFVFQWIDITGLPGGIWMVRATVDIQDYFDERVEIDNCTWAKIRIPAPGSSSLVSVIETGRDCGQEAIAAVETYPSATNWDPNRAVTFQPGTWVGYRFNSQGTTLRTQRWSFPEARPGTASARATPPGRSGRWLFVNGGPLAGYWFKKTSNLQYAD